MFSLRLNYARDINLVPNSVLYSRLQNQFPPITLKKILSMDYASQFWR